MNEHEWLNGTEPLRMVDFLRGRASERKFRLFAVSAYRHIWHWLTDATSRETRRHVRGCWLLDLLVDRH